MIAKRRPEPGLVPSALLGLAVWLAFCGRFLTGRLPAGDDLLNQFLPFQKLITESWRAGRLPQWNPWIFGGQPLLADPQLGVFYPPNFVHLILPPAWAFGWLFALHFLFLGVGCWKLARLAGLKPEAALLAAVLFTLNPIIALRGSLGHVTIIYTVAWWPWMGWTALRLAEKPGWGRLPPAALALAMPWLAGSPQFAYYGWLMTSVLLLFPPLDEPAHWRPRLAWGAAAFVLAAGVAAIQIIPTLHYMSQAFGRGAVWKVMTRDSLEPRLLRLFWNPKAFGDPRDLLTYQGGPQGYGEVCAYMPLWAMALLAIPALSKLWGKDESQGLGLRRLRVLAASAAILGVLLALGSNTPLYRVFFAVVPGFDRFRVPSRLLVLAAAGFAALAGLGLQDARLKPGRTPYRFINTRAIAVTIALVLMGFQARGHRESPGAVNWTVVAFFIAATFFAIDARDFPRKGAKWIRRRGLWILAPLAAAELILLATPLTPAATASQLAARPFARTPLIESLSQQHHGGRVLWLDDAIDWRMDKLVEELWPNRLLLHGLPDARGYYPVRLGAYTEFINALAGYSEGTDTGGKLSVPRIARPAFLTLAGVETVLSYQDLAYVPGLKLAGRIPLGSGRLGIWTWEDYRGLAFAAPLRTQHGDASALLRAAAAAATRRPGEPAPQALDAVFAEGEPRNPAAAPDARFVTQVVETVPGRLRMTTNYPATALFFISVGAWEGWQARVDNAAAPLLRASGAFWGIEMPGGKHEVECSFTTPGLATGWILSVIALFILGLATVKSFRYGTKS